MTKTQKGFTLIELLVVIAIIGILAGILFVAINPKAQTDKASAVKVKASLAQVSSAAAVYFTSQDPATFAGFTADNLINSLPDGVLGVDANGWAAQGSYTNTAGAKEFWCVDASGNATSNAAAMVAGAADTSCDI